MRDSLRHREEGSGSSVRTYELVAGRLFGSQMKDCDVYVDRC